MAKVRPRSEATKLYKASLSKLRRAIVSVGSIVAVFGLGILVWSWITNIGQAFAANREQASIERSVETNLRAERQAQAAEAARVQAERDRELYKSPWILYVPSSGSETQVWLTPPESNRMSYTYSFSRNGATHVVEGNCSGTSFGRFECNWSQQTSQGASSTGSLTLIKESETLFSGYETYIGKSDTTTTGITPIYLAHSREEIETLR